MGVTDLTEDRFDDEVLAEPNPVLVEFWAPWCGPCLRMADTIEALAAELAERVRVVRVDTDTSQELPLAYDVQSIPTLILFKDGRERARFVGRASIDALREGIDGALAGDGAATT